DDDRVATARTAGPDEVRNQPGRERDEAGDGAEDRRSGAGVRPPDQVAGDDGQDVDGTCRHPRCEAEEERDAAVSGDEGRLARPDGWSPDALHRPRPVPAWWSRQPRDEPAVEGARQHG